MSDNNRSFDVDFKAVKAHATFAAVLAHYELQDAFAQRGDGLIGRCCLGKKPHGKKDSLNINTEKNTFKCFACHKRGSVIDFVRFIEGMELIDAAKQVMTIMESGQQQQPHETDAEQREDVAYQSAFMRFTEARKNVDSGKLSEDDLIVVDLSTLQFLRGLIEKR